MSFIQSIIQSLLTASISSSSFYRFMVGLNSFSHKKTQNFEKICKEKCNFFKNEPKYESSAILRISNFFKIRFFVFDWDSLWPVIKWNFECSTYFTNDPS